MYLERTSQDGRTNGRTGKTEKLKTIASVFREGISYFLCMEHSPHTYIIAAYPPACSTSISKGILTLVPRLV